MELMRWLAALFLCCRLRAKRAIHARSSARGGVSHGVVGGAGGKVAWVSNARGVRNIMVAEPPAYQARKITGYAQDDGQELQDLRWTPDASAIVLCARRNGQSGLNPKGVSEDVWIADLDGSAPREIGAGSAPAISPHGGRIAFVRGGQIWWAPADGKTTASQAFADRGSCEQLAWSPDGARIAFTSVRGDHSLIGVYDFAAGVLRYLDAATDYDAIPAWSPDGRQRRLHPHSQQRTAAGAGSPPRRRTLVHPRRLCGHRRGPPGVARAAKAAAACSARSRRKASFSGRTPAESSSPGKATAGRISIPCPRTAARPNS